MTQMVPAGTRPHFYLVDFQLQPFGFLICKFLNPWLICFLLFLSKLCSSLGLFAPLCLLTSLLLLPFLLSQFVVMVEGVCDQLKDENSTKGG